MKVLTHPMGHLLVTTALAALGCSAEADSNGGTRGSGNTSQFGNSPATDPASTTATDGFGNTNAVAPIGEQQVLNPNAVPMAAVEASYIWIANSLEGTVTKLDTRTLEEKGRYLTSPMGLGLPSRTSVAEDGDVAVANRGGASNAIGGDGGGVIKIYASIDKCQDKNGNGMIDTSQGATDVRPWGEDECVAWFTPLPWWSNRPVAWAPPPAPDALADVWTAGATTCDGVLGCTIEVARLDGATGAIKNMVSVPGLSGVDFIGSAIPFGGVVILNYGPYGGAADLGGNFWTFVSNTTQLIRIDAVTLQPRIWNIEPAGNGYGLTLDEKGRIFVCGMFGLSRFDPSTETWQNSGAGGPLLGMNGCMTDGAGKIWVGGGVDFGDPGLHAYDADTLAHVSSYAVGPVKGVSIDVDGFVWGVGSGGAVNVGAVLAGPNGEIPANTAWRVDPNTGDVSSYTGLNGAYSYSDMTGFGLAQAGYQEPPPLE
ncbi:MAG: hypothetical protein OEZ06_27915 [Myxococcales bacterium]|nr:hypothetical protein [Myxococcales bacterium]